MSRVRSKNTKPELAVRSALHALGYRFRLHRKDLPGKPDVVLPKHRAAVFVHGCFWHQHPGCAKATLPKNNAEFWREKLEGNVARDARNRERLRKLGWRPIVVWECEVKRDLKKVAGELDSVFRDGEEGS
ncbi:MAG: very short patch repair endonuclease [Actinomycetota bacterium]|nr:very short patch repair endonuclease [Actinomycetota bacterium]